MSGSVEDSKVTELPKRTIADPMDPVKVKDVEIVGGEVSHVHAPMSIGQKLHIEKCFKVLRGEMEAALNGSQESLRARTNTAILNLEQAISANQASLSAQLAQIEKKLDAKYGGLYNTLIKTFLVKMEQRLLNAEMYTTGLYKTCGDDFTDTANKMRVIEARVNFFAAKVDMALAHTQALSKDPEAFMNEITGLQVVVPDPVKPEVWLKKYDDRVNTECAAFAEKAAKTVIGAQKKEPENGVAVSPEAKAPEAEPVVPANGNG